MHTVLLYLHYAIRKLLYTLKALVAIGSIRTKTQHPVPRQQCIRTIITNDLRDYYYARSRSIL